MQTDSHYEIDDGAPTHQLADDFANFSNTELYEAHDRALRAFQAAQEASVCCRENMLAVENRKGALEREIQRRQLRRTDPTN